MNFCMPLVVCNAHILISFFSISLPSIGSLLSSRTLSDLFLPCFRQSLLSLVCLVNMLLFDSVGRAVHFELLFAVFQFSWHFRFWLSSVSATSCIHRLHNFWSSPDWLLRCVLQCEEFASLSLKVIIYDIRGLYKLSLVTNKLFVYYCLLCLWSLVYVCSNFPSISCCLLSQITKYKIGSSRICFLYSPHVTSTGEFGLPSDHSFTGIARSLMNVLALFCLGRTCHYLCVTKF